MGGDARICVLGLEYGSNEIDRGHVHPSSSLARRSSRRGRDGWWLFRPGTRFRGMFAVGLSLGVETRQDAPNNGKDGEMNKRLDDEDENGN
jgi:hypothetical protein